MASIIFKLFLDFIYIVISYCFSEEKEKKEERKKETQKETLRHLAIFVQNKNLIM